MFGRLYLCRTSALKMLFSIFAIAVDFEGHYISLCNILYCSRVVLARLGEKRCHRLQLAFSRGNHAKFLKLKV